VLPLIAWIWVIKWRYGGSWITAGIDAFGVPFT